MSNFKNYGTQGIASDVQFGKAGGRLVFANGVFSCIIDPTGNTLARLQVASPVNFSDAVNLGALNAAVSSINASLHPDSIKSLDGSYVASVTSDGLSVLAGTEGIVIGSTSTGVVFSAKSASPNADIRLVPQGAGSVIIGDDSEDGLIQPAAGHNLTIAGGDAAVAGSVIIRAGHGTTNGHVEIHDLLDPVGAQDPATRAYTDAAILSSAASTQTAINNTISSISSLATSLNGVTATVSSFSSSLATTNADVASAAVATKDAIALAVSSIISSSLRASVASISEVAGDHVVMSIPAGTLLRLKVRVITAFSAGASITIRSATDVLASPSVIDEASPGIYNIELLETVAASDITVSIVTNGGTGTAGISLEFIAA